MEQLQKPGCKSQKHSVELKVQLLTGKEGVAGRRGVRVVDWKCPPYTDPRIILKKLSSKEITEDFLRQLVLWRPIENTFCSDIFVSVLGLFTGEWCFHPPCWEQRELPFTTARLAETCSKGKDEHQFDYRCAYLWFHTSTTADLGIGRPKERHAFKVLRGRQTNSREEANRGTDVSGRGDKHTQSSLEHREIFQTLFKATLYH